MKKHPVRCHLRYTTVGDRHNVEVYYPFCGFGYGTKLFMCRNCGELYAVDSEHLSLRNEEIPRSLMQDVRCISCNAELEETLVAYPKTFITDDGKLSHYAPPFPPPPDNETFMKNIWCLDMD